MIISAIYTFVIFLEIMLLIYMLGSWIFRIKAIMKYFKEFLEPLLAPLEFLSKKSILYMPIVELSPIVLLIILIYIERVLFKFL